MGTTDPGHVGHPEGRRALGVALLAPGTYCSQHQASEFGVGMASIFFSFSNTNTSPQDHARGVPRVSGGSRMGLTDPIVIETREDMKSEYRWRDRLEPFHHQVTNLITFCRRLPVTLLADDVGLGKTISAGLIMSELISRSRLAKILIVCPKLLGPQWQEELHTQFDIPSEIAIGRELITADPEETGAVITTYIRRVSSRCDSPGSFPDADLR